MEPGKAPGRSTPRGRSWGLRFPPTGSRPRSCRPSSSPAGRDKVQKGNKLIVINSAPYESRVATLESGILVAGDVATPRIGFDSDENGDEDFAEDIDIHVARYPQEQYIPPIEGLIREGQHLIVQVAKEPLGTKGARITSHISISRRIEDPEERERLHAIVENIRLDEMGAIVRTASEGRAETELKADMDYLIHHWDTIRSKCEAVSAPALGHRELSLPLRAVRDLFTADMDRIVG